MIRHLALFVFVLTLATDLVAADSRPNIVFLMADDQCTNSLGCYGNRDVITPNIDGLARDGVVFDNHYDTTSICMASRANVFTGMYEFKTGCNFGHGAMVRSVWNQSYPVLLRKAGYRTAIAGKIGIEVTELPGRKGDLPEDDFDAWGASSGQTNYATAKNRSMARYAQKYPHSTRSYGAFAQDFIRDSAQQDKPFCLSISFKAPHRPVTPDPVDDHVYKNKTFRKPNNYGRANGSHFAPQSRTGRQYERFFSWNYADKYDEVMAKYHQQIYAIDVAVGMVRDALKEHNVDENTVIIYTSDNGFLCGAHGYGSKVLPYEEASRVPLIIYDPRKGKSQSRRSDALTGNIDFAPTMLALAGVRPPESTDGIDLLPICEDPNSAGHDWLTLINVWGPASAHSLSVLSKDWKYIYWPYEDRTMKATEELFDTGGDPLEMANLSKDPRYRQDLAKMRAVYQKALKQWQTEAVDFHGYKQFGVIFDRAKPWAEKRTLIKSY